MSLCSLDPSSLSFCEAAASRFDALEELRFQLKLSLRLKEDVEAGVLGSSEVDVRVEGASFLRGTMVFVSAIDARTMSALTR